MECARKCALLDRHPRSCTQPAEPCQRRNHPLGDARTARLGGRAMRAAASLPGSSPGLRCLIWIRCGSRHIGNPEPDLPGNRMNDGKADSPARSGAGRWISIVRGTSGSLYRLAHWPAMAADRQRLRRDQWPGIFARRQVAIPHRYGQTRDLPLCADRRWRDRARGIYPLHRCRWRARWHDHRCAGVSVGGALGWKPGKPVRARWIARPNGQSCPQSRRPTSPSPANLLIGCSLVPPPMDCRYRNMTAHCSRLTQTVQQVSCQASILGEMKAHLLEN